MDIRYLHDNEIVTTDTLTLNITQQSPIKHNYNIKQIFAKSTWLIISKFSLVHETLQFQDKAILGPVLFNLYFH